MLVFGQAIDGMGREWVRRILGAAQVVMPTMAARPTPKAANWRLIAKYNESSVRDRDFHRDMEVEGILNVDSLRQLGGEVHSPQVARHWS